MHIEPYQVPFFLPHCLIHPLTRIHTNFFFGQYTFPKGQIIPLKYPHTFSNHNHPSRCQKACSFFIGLSYRNTKYIYRSWFTASFSYIVIFVLCTVHYNLNLWSTFYLKQCLWYIFLQTYRHMILAFSSEDWKLIDIRITNFFIVFKVQFNDWLELSFKIKFALMIYMGFF